MPLRNVPLQRKLIIIMLSISGMVLVLTCSSFFAYELLTFRQSLVRQLSTIAQIIANNSTAVLAFEDKKGAEEILAGLKAEPHIVAAGLYRSDGSLFTIYPPSRPAYEFPAGPAEDGYRSQNAYMIGFEPVVQSGKRLGTLYVMSDTKAMGERFRLYGAVALLIAAATSFLAFIISRRMQRQISGPILSLAETARNVTEQRDYSVRAKRIGNDELGQLTDGFNEMLGRVQEQLARMELLNRITRSIGERLDLPSIFQVLVVTLEDNLPVDFTCMCLYEADKERLSVNSVGAKSAPLAKAMRMELQGYIPIDQNGLARCVRGQLVYEPDVSKVDFPFPKRLASHGLRSLVIAPLIVESSVFGVLIAARIKAEAYSSMDCEFLRQLSDHAALAAHQAHLYGALQRAYDDLRLSQQTIMQQERLRALGQMASGIAHDINNAISPAALYTESLLESEPGLSPRAKGWLQTIGHAIEDVTATVGRMREFSRQRENQATMVGVQLNRALQQVIDLTRARWHDMPQQQGFVIKIETDLAPDLPLVLGVEGEIREALTNLFLNAFDAMPGGGTLTLKTRPAGRQVNVYVTDTGIGMDEETRRRCIEPFYTTKGERGTGLGLAMVYGVMQRHNAGVEIDSAVGKGTTMHLTFPIPDVVPAGSAQSAPVPIKKHPLRILVVDDDPMVADVLKNTLEIDGHEVVTADGGRTGIDTFIASVAENPFDVVVTDLGMPYLDGRKVAAEVKKASPVTPVILLTGWGQRLMADGDTPPHVDRLLSKPPKLGELREALAHCFSGAASGTSAQREASASA